MFYNNINSIYSMTHCKYFTLPANAGRLYSSHRKIAGPWGQFLPKETCIITVKNNKCASLALAQKNNEEKGHKKTIINYRCLHEQYFIHNYTSIIKNLRIQFLADFETETKLWYKLNTNLIRQY